jgi:hypothetical protein
VGHDLLVENAGLAVHDPRVSADAVREALHQRTGLPMAELSRRLSCEADAYRARAGAHALAVLTEGDEFRSLGFEAIYRSMRKPAFAFDGRNVLPHDTSARSGSRCTESGRRRRPRRSWRCFARGWRACPGDGPLGSLRGRVRGAAPVQNDGMSLIFQSPRLLSL